MATESESGGQSLGERAPHVKSVLVTALASLAGVAAGVTSHFVASGPKDTVGVAVFVAFAFASLLVMRLAGVDVRDFGAKDNLYVFFMTFALWFVTWGVILTGMQ